jgi:hypothetical protein
MTTLGQWAAEGERADGSADDADLALRRGFKRGIERHCGATSSQPQPF